MSFPDLPGQLPMGRYALPGTGSPGVAALANGAGSVRGAIAQAAQATGMDFSYLLAQARLESGLNPTARAATSSAAGLYQFTTSTWAQTLARHGAALGLGPQALADPASRAQLMGLRNNPQASALMAAAMAGDNQATLAGALGRPPTSAELYLAHFLGSDGAVKFLAGLASNPDQPAAGLFSRAAEANHAVFFDASGVPRSLGGVMELLGSRLASAMADAGQDPGLTDPGQIESWAALGGGGLGGGGPGVPPAEAPGAMVPLSAASPASPPTGPIAQEFAAVAAQQSGQNGGSAGAGGNSMAETLRTTFGAIVATTAGPTAPGFIRAAYGRLAALGL